MRRVPTTSLAAVLLAAVLLVSTLGAACLHVNGAQPLPADNPANSSAASTSGSAAADTGQVKCYDNSAEIACPTSGAKFSSQDAPFTGPAVSYTLTAAGEIFHDNATGLTWERSPGATSPTPQEGGMTITQTLSDGAQRNTIAFDGLAFLTGSLGADSFFPPGKVADFWGFQYLRDNDPTEMGHNTDFLTRASFNMLHVLTPAQRAELITLAQNQVAAINQYAMDRFVLMDAFRRLLAEDLPTGATGLSEAAVKAYSAQLYRLDGEISYARAQVMGGILRALTAEQQAYLDAMVGHGMLDWPDVGEPDELRGLERAVKEAVMTYAGDMFSWYAGSIEADVYFCPERQGTYFGSFYMKDAPAVGNPGYSIPVTMTAEMGEAFLAGLTAAQAPLITSLVEAQKPALYAIVDRREDVATLLRLFLTGETPNQEQVLALMETYGGLDGDIIFRYATAFAQVGQSLTDAQQTQFDALRTQILGDLSLPTGAYLYAEPISMPAIPNSDFLFGSAAATTAAYPVVDTSQAKCYNSSAEIACPTAGAAFYGQDAQFTRHAASYTLSADGLTVTDNVTGLTWEHSPDTNGDGSLTKADKLTYANALAHCAAHSAASYQGYNDWRLPTIKELYSLIDFRGTDPSGYTGSDTSGLTPFIDRAYFQFAYGQISAGERIIDSQYASGTLYAANSTKLFGVNFADGRIKGYDLTMPGGAAKTFFVQCVRGNTGYGINSFTDNADGTVTDSATGLMWAQSDSGAALNWQDALAWVQTKNAQTYLGHSDWRLPNAKELQSIVDYTRSPNTTNSAAINPIFSATSFVNEEGQTDWPWYWASTTHAAYNGMGAAGVYLAFGRATGWQKATPSATCYSLYDVHGAGSQRSDPKTSSGLVIIGPACNGGMAYGLGPQGDVQRAANHVRLVRDAPRSIRYLPLIITRAGADVVLTWTDEPAAAGGYQVWWSVEPYFVAGAAGSHHASVSAPPYTDSGATSATKYYLVLGMDEAGQTVSESHESGVLIFSLTAGTTF